MRRSMLAVAMAVSAMWAQDQPSTMTPAAGQKLTIDQRQALQQQRIGNGVQNGSLTTGEAAKLRIR